MDSPFDVLAKTIALAEGMPRREAVRRVGGALAAVALSSLGVGCAGGGGGRSSSLSPLPPAGTSSTGRTPLGGGNSDCAHFCQQLPPGPQRGQCVSDAAQGTGLCYQCDGDVTRLCAAGVGGAYVCCREWQVCCGRPGGGTMWCGKPGKVTPGVPGVTICCAGVCCNGACCAGSYRQCCPNGFHCVNGACL
jgi:hypothetical protein